MPDLKYRNSESYGVGHTGECAISWLGIPMKELLD